MLWLLMPMQPPQHVSSRIVNLLSALCSMGIVVGTRMISATVTCRIVVAVFVAMGAVCITIGRTMLVAMGTMFIGTISVVVRSTLAIIGLVQSVMFLRFLENMVSRDIFYSKWNKFLEAMSSRVNNYHIVKHLELQWYVGRCIFVILFWS